MWVWAKAVVDLPFWQERKASGIYCLSLRKEGMGPVVFGTWIE